MNHFKNCILFDDMSNVDRFVLIFVKYVVYKIKKKVLYQHNKSLYRTIELLYSTYIYT